MKRWNIIGALGALACVAMALIALEPTSWAQAQGVAVDSMARGLALKAQTTANAALPKAGGTMTGTITSSGSPALQAASGSTVIGGSGVILTGGAKLSDLSVAVGWQTGSTVVAANGLFGFSTSSDATTGTNGPIWRSGTGTPEGVVTAPVGSIFSRTNGGAATSFYVKESGSGNTGWVAK